MSNFENLLIIGDFNSSTDESYMSQFCDIYNLKNVIIGPTCFKNPLTPSAIDVILTNKKKCFQNSQVIETGLSDRHKMTLIVLKIILFFIQHQLSDGQSHLHV